MLCDEFKENHEHEFIFFETNLLTSKVIGSSNKNKFNSDFF